MTSAAEQTLERCLAKFRRNAELVGIPFVVIQGAGPIRVTTNMPPGVLQQTLQSIVGDVAAGNCEPTKPAKKRARK